MILKKIKDFFKQLAMQESSAQKLALSFCIGNYIAFSPFPFFHTIMVFIFTWLFQLNFAVTFASSAFINNPGTALPIYTADYLFGYWIIREKLCLNVESWLPWPIAFCEDFLHAKIGLMKPFFWSFIIGGNILGIILSIALYPLMKYFFRTLLTAIQTPPLTPSIVHENPRAE